MADRLGYCRFCASFNRENNVPYFPAAYHKNNYATSLSESLNVCTDIKNDLDNKDGDSDMYNAKEESKNIVKNIATIGLESAEEVFHVFHAINSKEGEWMHKGSRKLNEVMLELLKPTEKIASENCEKLNIYHCSIDATVNPGLSIDDSIAVVSAIAKALKNLRHGGIKTIGYNGLTLPVMVDLVSAKRATETNPPFGIRDLLVLSSVYGASIDTVPVPGDITAEKISSIYAETAALSFRINKPLSCRLLIILMLKTQKFFQSK